MEQYQTQIFNLEKNKRIAITRQYPVLLPFVLETKRSINSVKVISNQVFDIKRIVTSTKWFNLTEHSSPLYRKYNKRELDEGKIENIKIAIKNIDQLVIPPGKIFSFWKFVGRPSIKRGFKNGLVLSAGQLKEDVGGGLCQLSNLLGYMFAGTECMFIERKHHSKDVFPDSGRTVPFASGATVFFNLIDLKVKNTYPFPIKINLRTTDTQLRGSISGPIQLDYFIKLKETDTQFIKSKNTGIVYRCNTLVRVFYNKISKQEIRKESLWVNVAEVMYKEADIAYPILNMDISMNTLYTRENG
jgi:vancomycin resistance protein VanW